MKYKTFANVDEFLQAVQPALEADEAANNLLYGLALQIRRNPQRYLSPYFGGVYDRDRLHVAALMTPPHNLVVLSAEGSRMADGFAAMAAALRQAGWVLPGVIGPSAAAQAFAQAWESLTGEACRLLDHERLYQLRQVSWPVQTPGILPGGSMPGSSMPGSSMPGGSMRLATAGDLELCARWLYDFTCEALPDEAGTLEDARETARYKIEDGNFFLWEDGGPAALAGKSRPTPNGACIGPVYTPPERRARGYATALTAALSQHLLDGGKQFVTLFTNLANPVSNSIYMKIGYTPVCDFDRYHFGVGD